MRKLVLLMVLALASFSASAQRAQNVPVFRQLTDDEKKIVNVYNFTKNATIVSGLVTGVSVCGSVIYQIEYRENLGHEKEKMNHDARNGFLIATAVGALSTTSFYVANRLVKRRLGDKVVLRGSINSLILEF